MKISNKYAADVIRVMLEDNEKEPWRPVYLSGLRLEALAMAVNALDKTDGMNGGETNGETKMET